MKKMLSPVKLAVAIFLTAIIGVQTYVLIENSLHKKPLTEYATQIIDFCSQKPYRPSCYDAEIPKLMDVLSMEEAFEVTKLVQEKDDEYWYCHVLGHNVSAREVAKNPQKWQTVLGRCPSGVCSNGCLHGGLQEKFRAESLTDEQIEQAMSDLEMVCSDRDGWHPTGLEKASCYHAIGHLTMYITQGDIHKSTILCDRIAYVSEAENYLQTCYEGAFMQIFQPLEDEDFALVEGLTPKKNDLSQFCSQFNPEKQEACWREGWPLYWSDIQKPGGVTNFCNRARQEDQVRCYNSIFYVYTAQKNLEPETVISFCSTLPEKIKGQCFGNAASRMIETDYRMVNRSAQVCQEAEKQGVGKRCYEELLFYSTFNFHKDSPEFVELCQALPETWKEQCLYGDNSKLNT